MTKRTLKASEVALYIGVTRRNFYKMLTDKRFPVPPLPDTKPLRWSTIALDEYLAGRDNAAL